MELSQASIVTTLVLDPALPVPACKELWVKVTSNGYEILIACMLITLALVGAIAMWRTSL